LNVDHYQNGDTIPEVTDPAGWMSHRTEAWYYYDNNPENGKKYGKLYNWYAINDPRGLAPKDWHIPTYAELKALVKEVNQDSNSLKAVDQDNISTNKSVFSALMSGVRYENTDFRGLEAHAAFWSSSDYNKFNPYVMSLYFEEFDIKFIIEFKEYGFTVGCNKKCTSNKVTIIILKSSRICE
jgi:uncharacterized protein (TIGR02145 family)